MHRVFFFGGLVCLAFSTLVLAQESGEKVLVNKAATVKFEKSTSRPDCATRAVERGDPSKGPAVLLNKFTPGCSVPWHWHTANGTIMITSGTVRFEMRGEKPVLTRRGDYVFMPGHHVHQETCLGSVPCLLFIHTDGILDIHYVDKADKEIPLEQALKANSGRP
ncbi:MAG TPA: cupin domain-containing protein [Candidatus Acidoferrales bacterium]|nr:cupin domain-containing protein [Candidatus Acidoferrales bacterium]